MIDAIKYFSAVIVILSAAHIKLTQSNPAVSGWKTRDYPDPRVDFVKCGSPSSSPGLLCDPDGLLTDQERVALKLRIADIEEQSKKVVNKSPYCPTGAPGGLFFFIILMNKIDAYGVAVGQLETKRFTYEIKEKYDPTNNNKECDTTVIIVCSLKDGQLYTVAGRDIQLTGDILEGAFNHSRYHFSAGNLFGGMADLISELAVDYGIGQGSQILNLSGTETDGSSSFSIIASPSSPTSSNITSNPNDKLEPVGPDNGGLLSSTRPSNPFLTTSSLSPDADKAAPTSNKENVTSVSVTLDSSSTIVPSTKKALTIKEREELASGNEEKQTTPIPKKTDSVDSSSSERQPTENPNPLKSILSQNSGAVNATSKVSSSNVNNSPDDEIDPEDLPQ